MPLLIDVVFSEILIRIQFGQINIEMKHRHLPGARACTIEICTILQSNSPAVM